MIASFFTVAMAAMLLGAVVTTQIQRPAEARSAAPALAEAPGHAGAPLTFDTFKDIARRQTLGVVNVSTSKVVKGQRSPLREFFGDDLLERFGPGDRGRPETQRSLGSGFVIDKVGYILTNRHVVEGADQISVSFPGGKNYEAKLVGRDARTDVALLKIEPNEPLTALDLGDSDQVEVGEWVMAVGNPFGLPGGGNSVTVGVVSFKGRDLPLGVRGTSVEMIQTDAAINPGNSGGPLLNTRGQVIGINTLIITDGGARQSAGVGFSVPINVAKEILPQLRDKGKVTRGWMGVRIQRVDEDLAKTYRLKEAKGAVISQVDVGSPAERAGLKAEDVVVSVDGRPIQDNGDLTRYISSQAPGKTVKLDILREGGPKTISVTLGTFAEEKNDEEAATGQKGKLGMTLLDLTPALAEKLDLPRDSKGALVREVEAGTPAEDAGLQRGDVIVSVNGSGVSSVEDFEKAIERARREGAARLRVQSGQTNRGFRIVVLKLK
jgi:serine protease Do